MISFKEQFEQLNEKLITFGGKAYPSSGHVVLLVGGSGVGKGFISDNLLGIEGKVFDVDKLKSLAIRVPKLTAMIYDKFGVKPEDIDMKNPDHVSMLHNFLGKELELPDKTQTAFFSSMITTPADEKPNIIFDVTLRNLSKLTNISYSVSKLGYEKKNIHLVWVMNKLEIAQAQNKTRPRYVDPEIVINTHLGVSMSMHQILTMGSDLKKYMDGEIVLTFNQAGVDNKMIQSILPIGPKKGMDSDKLNKGGSYMKEATYIYLKRVGKNQLKPSSIDDIILRKMVDYVPKDARQSWKQWIKDAK